MDSKVERMTEGWDKYKDLEYYPDKVCKCGCSGKIKVKSTHKYTGIPKYIHGHNRKGKNHPNHVGRKRIPRETRACACDCGGTFECIVTSKQRFIHGHNAKEGHSPETKAKCYKIHNRPDIIAKHRAAGRKNWQDPEYVAKQMRARNVCPNKAEIFLDGFFQDLLPNEYKFVGDGKDEDSIVAGKCPDFTNINGQKKIIELFGEHVHKPEEEQERADLFAQCGYQTLIIWYNELKNLDLVKQKVLEFNNVERKIK